MYYIHHPLNPAQFEISKYVSKGDSYYFNKKNEFYNIKNRLQIQFFLNFIKNIKSLLFIF